MLGAWAEICTHSNILEVGTGTGIISLMLAQKGPSIEVLAIDKNPRAVHLAKANFRNSTWTNRLKIQIEDYRNPNQELLNLKFDHIISNPPFFKNGVLSDSEMEQNSRHSIGLELSDLIYQSSNLLKPNGTIQLILPYARLPELKDILKKNNLNLNRVTTIKATSTKAPYRILVELSKQLNDLQSSSITMYSTKGKYSADYRTLLSDYLVIF